MKASNFFPEIKGITYECPANPSLITVPIRLLNAAQVDMGLDKVERTICSETIDLDKLMTIRSVYTRGIDSEVVENECMIMLADEEHIVLVSRANMLKAWIFNKTFIR